LTVTEHVSFIHRCRSHPSSRSQWAAGALPRYATNWFGICLQKRISLHVKCREMNTEELIVALRRELEQSEDVSWTKIKQVAHIVF
jgi:hypothetical protein